MTDPGAEPGPLRASDWRHLRTERLCLDRPTGADIDDLWAIHGDPDSWRHFPSGVHSDPSCTEQMRLKWRQWWDRDGLCFWSVREHTGGPVIGCGGCSVGDELPWWNLYYRFAASVQRCGYAVEMGRTALTAARDVMPERPVIAFMLEHNLASRRTAERLGMQRIWHGPDAGNPDPHAVRLVFCDRDPDASLLAAIGERFGPG